MPDPTTWRETRPAIRADVATVEALALAAATEVSVNASSHLCATANMRLPAWQGLGWHTVFDVTGAVRMRLWAVCTTDLASANNRANLTWGVPEGEKLFCATTDCSLLTAGGFWCDETGSMAYVSLPQPFFDYTFATAIPIGYNVDGGEALEAGVLEFHCVWEALDAMGHVAVGTGGGL